MGIVTAICISRQRRTRKEPVSSACFEPDYGIAGDAHAGTWHRQVSLLQQEKVDAFREKGAAVTPGAFGENMVVRGIDFRSLPVGTLLRCGDVLLEVTQIGKECHTHCAIYHQTGDCIMPREGVFAKVIQRGEIAVGDEMQIERRAEPMPWQAAVITLSDQGAAGLREDKSGPAIADRLRQNGYEVIEQLLLPDDRSALERELIRLCDQRQPDLILTTGGTGFSARDITPEATIAVGERNVPGIAEAIRAASMQITKRAMLSRAASVIRGKTLIINLPGSPKACMESMDVFLDTIPHGLGLLRGTVHDCARTDIGEGKES
ncbi:MAG: molybdopterin-binding protein [Butyricicoccaceae bacterium]